MHSERQRSQRGVRLPVVLCLVGAILAIMLACGFPTTVQQTHARLTFCVVDSAQSSACDAAGFAAHHTAFGDFSALNSSQTVRVQLLDTGTGKPIPQVAVTWAVAGANAHGASATTNGSGIAALSYTGTAAGTDTISATLPSSFVYPRPLSAVIHWVAPQSHTHPIIFVHGINENANDVNQHKDWTALFEALNLVYDPSDIETFCYVDDHAYADPSQPSHCPAPDSSACTSQCVSQSSVDDNAVELARRVIALHQRAGAPVTLMGYSMGTAIIRTLLAGCLNTPTAQDSDVGADGTPDTDVQECDTARGLVDDAFFLNGVQQGSWLMTVKAGLDATSLAGDSIPAIAASPFYAVMPTLEQDIFSAVKNKMGLDANSPAATDLTPGSANITQHNSVPIPTSVKVYTFYGAIQLRLDVHVFAYQLAGTSPLTLGDLVLLAQQDAATSTPIWGGASLCDACDPLDASTHYHGSTSGDQFHTWALVDQQSLNIADIIPSAGPTLQATLNAPESHLNISQPVAQSPGSSVQVKDITGLASTSTTDMADEIVLVLLHQDGIL